MNMKKNYFIVIIVFFWIVFPILSYLGLNNGLSYDFLGKSFVLASLYLLAVPVVFNFLFYFLLFKNKQSKKFFILVILAPIILWSLIIVRMYVLPVVFFNFG